MASSTTNVETRHPAVGNDAIRHRRIVGALVAICAAGILGLAAWLTPSTEGIGTHQQMGLPECGWVTLMDLPCPTCGMTTSFAFAAEGDMFTSFKTQPLGAMLAIATAMSFLVGSFVALTGSRVGSMFSRLWGRWSGWIIAGLIVVAWIYKVISYKGGIG
ncbi:MAG: DUF2752 domain-containing protein [Planctomycetota bacterium]|nr:DUF2752 domain-containing protein [Planctomycetota bacterium]